MSDVAQMSGPLVDELLSAVADAMEHAIDQGMEPMQAASAVAIVAADYSRAAYGDEVLEQLAGTVTLRKGLPLEFEEEEAGHA
jgi:hypothetical protein